MKTNVARLLTGALALALLLAVGLSASNSAQAQTVAPGTITVDNEYLCSLPACATTSPATNASGAIAVAPSESGTVEVTNLDVAKVSMVDPTDSAATISLNPRTITIGTGITVVQEFTDANDDGAPDLPGEIRAFNGNRIQIKYTPTSGFATFKTILVDNVKPTLVTTSPDIPLVVKGGVDITFTADITDGGSGYTTKSTGDGRISTRTATAGVLAAATNGTTPSGGVRLVVAGNVVSLADSNFEAIDGGWRVSRSLGSSAIQNIGANVPWYFETRDRAGNTRRSSGSIPLSGTVTATGITDARFAGGLPAGTFTGTMMKVTKGSASKTVGIDTFTGGVFTLVSLTADNFFTEADGTTVIAPVQGDKFELVASNLITIDNQAPDSPAAITGVTYSTSKKMAVRGLSAKANSIQVTFDDDGKADGDNAGSGLDPASVTPSAFTVSGNTVTSVAVYGNAVYLTLENNLASDEQPSVTIANGVIMDKAGNAASGERIGKAADGLGPNLSLSEDADLSKTKVTVTIATDEQLASLPDVKLGRVINDDGDIVVDGTQECVYAAVDASGSDPALPAVTRDVTVASDGTVGCAAVADLDPPLHSVPAQNTRYLATTPSDVAGQPDGSPSPSQTAALSYTYAVTAAIANPAVDGTIGGKYNVYVTGVDTQHAENMGQAGHSSDANNSAAFTFQLDEKLNGDGDPIVSVSDNENVADDDTGVEQISPMIITVDWKGESGEYPGDSYRTVEMTSAVLKVTFADGSSESTTFDLDTEVSSQDSIKYTIPLLNPKVGSYTLTVKGTDSAGNASGTSGHAASWKVTAPKAVNIAMKPGWNLISLPFQPANPAINSIIPADHPASLVMTYDSAEGVWLFSRRDADSGMFTGEVGALTAVTAYFVNTDSFEPLKLFRTALATATAAPAQPPAIPVTTGWNLVPVASNKTPMPKGIDADMYFGTLGTTWLQALAWDPLARTWISISKGTAYKTLKAADGVQSEKDRCDDVSYEVKADATEDVVIPATVCTGEGLWLWVNKDGTLIPRS